MSTDTNSFIKSEPSQSPEKRLYWRCIFSRSSSNLTIGVFKNNISEVVERIITDENIMNETLIKATIEKD